VAAAEPGQQVGRPQQAAVGLVDREAVARQQLALRSAPGPPQPGDPAGGLYTKRFDDRADLALRADEDGRVELGRNPSARGPIVMRDGYTNAVAIVRVEHEGRVAFAFLESSAFNLECWRGRAELGQYELTLAFR
jgi:hypothetical protein